MARPGSHPSTNRVASRDHSADVGSIARPFDYVGAGSEVPAGHDVGEGVVVHRLVVLVGAHHSVDMAATFVVDAESAGPVAGSVDDEIATRTIEEAAVARPFGVVVSRPGDVGHDVLFRLARPDLDRLTVVAIG